ncbi:hypothetical protein ABZU25_33880 [Micromonospora sp. NPDC005215]|uniref:hypothetical protein n=1 Tax=Micromonospora sp. NPDC005215 TaxID=3157024 RepID=UPI0033B32868
MTTEDDGRNTQWPPGSLAVDLWETVLAETDLSGTQVGMLRVAMDDLNDAEHLLTLARSGELSDRDTLAAFAGARSARKAALAVVAVLTNPGTPPANGWGGRRPGAGAKAKPVAHRGASQHRDGLPSYGDDYDDEDA